MELKSHASAYEKAIQCSGVIDANRIEEQGGEIYLVGDGGSCEVSGNLFAHEGKVHVLGNKVGLFDGTQIDVSGENGGGEILIGGDFRGENEKIPNAEFTFVGEEVSLRADAKANGNGGKIIVWGDQATRHYGKLSARGGVDGGNGGLIEVSGDYLEFRGTADTMAPSGQAGQLLLDPTAITINSTGPTSGGSFSSCAFAPGSNTTSVILISDLVTQLGSCNVTIDASAGSGGGAGTITLSDALTWGTNGTTTNTLTLLAPAGTITLTGAVTVNGVPSPTSNYLFTASTQKGITVTGGITIAETSNAANFNGLSLTNSGTGSGSYVGVNIIGCTITSKFGNISISGTGGQSGTGHGIDDAGGNSAVSSTGIGLNAATITVIGKGGNTAGHGMAGPISYSSVDGNISLTGTGCNTTTSDGGIINLPLIVTTGSGNPSQTVSLSGTGLTSSAQGIHMNGASLSQGTLQVTTGIAAGFGIGFTAGAGITAPTIIIGTESGGTFSVRSPSSTGISLSVSIGNSSTTSLSMAGSGGSSGTGISVSGNFTVGTGGTISLYGANTSTGLGISVGAGRTIQSTAGSVSLRGTTTGGTAGISLASTSVVRDTTSGSVSFNTASTTQTTSLNGATITSGTGNITFGGPVSLGATQSITTASPGTITFQSTATINGAQALTLTATSSTIAINGAIGGSTRLSSLSMTASTINLGANISLNNSSLTFPVTVLTGNSTLNTGTTGAAITFNSTVNDNGSGPYALTLQGGTGAITLSGIIGGTAPIGALSIATGASLALGENISASSLSVASGINATLSKSGTTAITTTGASGISFAGTITGTVAGSQALTLAAGTGPITLSGAVGGTRLGAMTVSTTNNTADQGFRFDANITANSLDASGVTRTTVGTNATVNTSGNNGTIEFGGIDSISAFNRTLTLNSGSGKIWIHGAVGANQKLGTLTITSSNTTVGQGFGIGGVINLTNFSDLSLTNLTPNPITVLASLGTAGITTTNSAISFTQTIDAQTSGSGSFTLNAGTSTISLSGAIGGTTPLGPFTCTAGTSIALPTSTKTAGGAIAINGPVPMSAAVALDSTNGGGTAAGANISITGAVTGAQALTLRAGSAGAITFGSTVGTSLTRVTTLTLTSGVSLSLAGSLFLTNSVAIPMATTLTGNAEINTGL